jgi:hypothetical protein
MKPPSALIAVTFTLALSSAFSAENRGTLVFEDHFDRSESQETTEEIGNGWTTNSKTRAGGHKQVDLKNGAMHITMHATADHAVGVAHAAEFRDGSVEMRFMLENQKDVLGLDIADPECKEVHSGHLIKIDVSTGQVVVNDTKTGQMNLKFEEARKAKSLTPAQSAFIASKRQAFPNTVAIGQWHDLLVTIRAETVSVSIDGKPVAAFSSEGVAHPTKRVVRLVVPREVWVDDLKVFALTAATSK